MIADLFSLTQLAPAFVLGFARIGAAMASLPGVGESSAPATVRAGLAFGITILLLPEISQVVPVIPASGLSMSLMVASEVFTGLWFGWLARMLALALPMAAQMIGYLVGLSSVLEPDPELGAQAGVIGKLFEVTTPVLLLASGLYRLPLYALVGSFHLILPGHILPSSDGSYAAVHNLELSFDLALQLASPFIILAVIWHLAMGVVARFVSRMQIYFISIPGQILVGFILLLLTTSSMMMAWQERILALLTALPGVTDFGR